MMHSSGGDSGLVLRRSLALLLFASVLSVAWSGGNDTMRSQRKAASPRSTLPGTVDFFYTVKDGGLLTCNGKQEDPKIPTKCSFDKGELTITRAGWGTGVAILSREDGTITGPCNASLIPNDKVQGQYNLTADCVPGGGNGGDPNAGPRAATGERLVDEWFADLPWHQKLSTKNSNDIDIPFVLPFEALSFTGLEKGKAECEAPATAAERARCILRYGIVNVMGLHRTDTLYNADEAPQGQDCQAGNCVEVKLQIQRFHTLTDDPSGYEPDLIRNNPLPVGTPGPPSLGFAITEATIFAPWRPWYMGHFCGVKNARVDNSVCYDDYFTTQLQASGPGVSNWLNDRPALFVPRDQQGIFGIFCQRQEQVPAVPCSMFLGKVDWDDKAKGPEVPDPGCEPAPRDPRDPDGGDFKTCEEEIDRKTADLDEQFDDAITHYVDIGRYPWNEKPNKEKLGATIPHNPFIGFYELTKTGLGAVEAIPRSTRFNATHYVLPKQCSKMNFLGARSGNAADVAALKNCALNFEIHSSGFHEIWQKLFRGDVANSKAVEDIDKAVPGSSANQYGRTMFMFAGIGEQKIPVSFQLLGDGLSIHDKMYGSSIYTQYLPMVNPADQSLVERSYTQEFWHGLLMSNHMNQTPDHFIRGIRGRTLWHNEYRSLQMYLSAEVNNPPGVRGTPFEHILGHVDFPAGFQVANHTSPFHGNTCDACHVRNGSGIPLMPNGQLPEIHRQRGMKDDFAVVHRDYTYTNVVPPPTAGPETARFPSMKMVLFDLKAASEPLEECDDNDHTVPLRAPDFYTNKVMNFYGNSFPVNLEDASQNPRRRLPTYTMEYVVITDGDGFEIVDTSDRAPYLPRRVAVSNFETGNRCTAVAEKPEGVDAEQWPANCQEVNGQAVENAIAGGEIGFLHLLGRRLGNTPLIEMIPDQVIMGTKAAQQRSFKHAGYAGCFGVAPGTRVGAGGAMSYRSCTSGVFGASADDCYISRWGWMGDRASLEDQIANAASVEMNITSKEGYAQLHPGANDKELVRYNDTLCGPADKTCIESQPNSDITEQEIRDMATYQRWIGIPQRSEFQVSSDIVQKGEQVFKDLKCDSCHVIRKIPFVEADNMLPDEEREHLKSLEITVADGGPEYPFVSYLGTDLLLHDMGYLSQVARAPEMQSIRDTDGTVKRGYEAYVQRIRTPPLKGLRLNAFVTDSNQNTTPISRDPRPVIPGCDFLLHDGRACDAIEAAFLHDGPAIKALRTIDELNKLSETKLEELRAFLYSL